MTKVKIYRKGKEIKAIELEGHSGYDEYGKDIVCSALSTVVQMVELGIREVLKCSGYDVEQDKERGFMGIYMLDSEDCEKAQILLETAAKSLKAIEKGYSDYVKVWEVAHND